MKPTAEAGSRERMLEAAIELMRGSGLSGAGINEIVRASGAPKGSVYHFFPAGKQQLAGEALAAYALRVREFMDRALAGERPPSEKIRALFNAFARRVEEGGFRRSCAVGTVTLDLEPGMDALREVLAAAFADWVALIAAHLAFADRRRAVSFAGLVLSAIEGAYIRARAERSSRPFKEAGAWLAELAQQQA
ncbi:MAG TPA: TetR family transcriptional regulator C-terminal domain-containing protein [Pelomicrobium sp.]|nr:TetR family transcriptional regulator C-terminal domain-containing protein [Pelomicrobium sp.]